MAAGKGKQFLLLFWKNWIIQKRKICCTITEIVVPIFLALILLLIRQTVEAKKEQDKLWASFEVNSLPPELSHQSTQWKLAFTPNNSAAHNVMRLVGDHLGVAVECHGFDSEANMKDALLQENDIGFSFLGGVVFTSAFPNGNLPDKVQYKLRLSSVTKSCSTRIGNCSQSEQDAIEWRTDFQFPQGPQLGPREEWSEYGGEPGYYEHGFLAIQRAIDRAIIILQSSLSGEEVDEISMTLQRHPYPEYVDDPFVLILQAQFPMYIMLTFLFTAPCIVKDVVLEKERKLKETMKLMGLNNWLHWTAWFLKYFVFLLIADIFMTIFYCIDLGKGGVVNYSDPVLFFVFLLIYTIAVIMFCFAISVFFSSANTAAAAAGILFFLSYVPYFFFAFNYYSLSLGTKIGVSLLPNVAMAFCCVLLALQEANGVGMQWDNFYRPVNVNDELTWLYMFFILLLDCLICFIIVWYVDNVKPGEFGVPKPWYFPFTKWYWCGGSREIDPEAEADGSLDATQHEPLPAGAKSGIRIRGLRKVFNESSKNPRVAVDDLNLDMMEGQITALLGHNGAGKTTTMFMLTGFLEPTKGNAVIGGYDIRKNLDKVRENLGLCPQHDVLFDSLTVKEHLQFFGSLKGCENLDKEVKEMIQLLHLEDKTNRQAHTLSGGMKRKLCVGIALIGGSKVIILDEPTSGMDPEARRQTWDILQKARRGRTMLLTTHFMDEADYLGDRIAIMAQGKLVTSGSSLFLKKRYGVGYHMNMVKTETCDVDKVALLIRKYVPDAGLESDAGAELSFVLPHESSGRFEELFNTLDAQKSSLGISSWGASITTMEEVFLKVGDYDVTTRNNDASNGATNGKRLEGMDNPSYRGDNAPANGPVIFKDERVYIDSAEAPAHGKSYSLAQPANNGNRHALAQRSFSVEFKRNTGIRLLVQQFWAMFLKRIINTWRSPVVSAVQLAIPVLFAALGCIVKYTIPDSEDPTPLTLKFDNFEDPLGPYKGETNVTGLESSFMTYMQSQGVDTMEVTQGSGPYGLMDYLLDQADEDLQTFLNSHIVAGYFADDVTNGSISGTPLMAHGFFNNEALHAPAMAVTAISNTILRFLSGNNDLSIETVNHPLPLPTTYQADDDLDTARSIAFTISYNVAFGMSFLIATFVTFLIKERAVKAKHCQYTSGVPVAIFWLGTYLWDIINYLIPCFVIIILFVAFDIEGYIIGSSAGACILLFIFYGLSVLPFVYLISFLFDVPATGYVVVVVINILTGTVASVAVFIMKIPGLNTEDIAETLEWIFYILLPNFCFINGLQELYNNYNAEETCKKVDENEVQRMLDMGVPDEQATFDNYCSFLKGIGYENSCCEDNCGEDFPCATFQDNPLDWDSPGVGRAVFFMFIQAVIYFGIICFLESGIAKRLKQNLVSRTTPVATTTETVIVTSQVSPQATPTYQQLEDDDVARERARIQNTPLAEIQQTDSLILRNLTKYYGGFLAVDNLSLGIKQGECFGLLGVNGAGKTTTFKMLTGDETISAGDAYVRKYNVASQIKQVQQQVGYCPQFDALIEKLTVTETLSMYARLRGVRESEISEVVDNLIQKLLLTEYAKKLAGNLSGGNKRKLSTAIALVGDPPIVFLDEPTTGMDPVARRQLWNTLVQVREEGRTIILTSHSMEECEALCTRLVVMVNGQFKCVGASQHLKDKFGEGFALMAKVTPGENQMETQGRTNNLMGFIQHHFPNSVLKDFHPGLVLYQISTANTTLAQVFGLMERNKEQLFIEDYSVSQTTLEQVFINFARAQRPPLDENALGIKCCRGSCCCCT